MVTYQLTIERTADGLRQTTAYSTATNAIDDLEGLRTDGVTVSAIHRDGQIIDEATLRAEEVVATFCIG